MESVGLKLFGDIYRGRRVLLTGHTGFKGSWLTLWLGQLEAQVVGLALAPTSEPNHWHLLGQDIDDRRQDIRDYKAVERICAETEPEIVFHLAAQPLVRRSYLDPLETWSTNVLGTANILEACRHTPSVRAVVVVTSDKCYENQESSSGYRESDRLGGHDPYSASKASAELVTASYRSAYFQAENNLLVASVRAGNVIGGGDWSEDRLIPDIARAIDVGTKVDIRFPSATRPWQHVLDPLAGYLLLGQRLLEGQREYSEAWNFGPDQDGNHTVMAALEGLQTNWPEILWQVSTTSQPHEAALLQLDSTKARVQLGWHPVWDFQQTLAETARWYRTYQDQGKVLSCEQLESYIQAARAADATWCAG